MTTTLPSPSFPSVVRIVEVGPRDGLQNEKTIVPTATKIELIRRLAACGLPSVEVGAFVSPKWVPQMADSAEVLAAVRDLRCALPVLTPNLKGLEAALAAGAKEVAVFAAASEGFSQANINCSVAESLERFRPVMARAAEAGVAVRGYVSCVLGCPYDGAVAPEKVAEVTAALIAMGCYEVSLGDTIGAGTPDAARAMAETVITAVPATRLALHFHDTGGRAVENMLACLPLGIATVDASVAGLGGCPYAKGATGNVATEDVVAALHANGIETRVVLASLRAVGDWISKELDRPNGAKQPADQRLTAQRSKAG